LNTYENDNDATLMKLLMNFNGLEL